MANSEKLMVEFKLSENRPDWWPIPDGATFEKMCGEIAMFTNYSWRARHITMLFLISIEHDLVEQKQVSLEIPLNYMDIWDQITTFHNNNQAKIRKHYWNYIDDVIKYFEKNMTNPEVPDCLNLVLKDMFQLHQEIDETPEQIAAYEYQCEVESGYHLDS